MFPDKGCEELIAQVVGLGRERHDDLADALSMVVSEASKTTLGYHPFSLRDDPMDNKIEPGEEDDFADERPITAGIAREWKQFQRTHGRSGIF